MEDDKIQWTLDLIKKLQYWKIGDYSRLEAIKDALENGRVVYESDKQYLKQKHTELEALETGLPPEKTEVVSETKQESKQDNPSPVKDTAHDQTHYCGRCGFKLQSSSNFCPKCGTQINQQTSAKSSEVNVQTSTSSDNKRLQRPPEWKSEGVTLVLTIALGLLGLGGIGHIYLGKLLRGIVILIVGIILLVITVVSMGIGLIILIPFAIWVIFDARNLCREYNAYYEQHGRPPNW